jgi:D-alanine-D-alanine ligase
VRNSTKEIASLVQENMQLTWHDLPQLVDFVFIALHGGKGENGAVQGTLEMLGLPYNGSSVLTSALCMDKYKTTQFLRSQQFDVPNSMLITRDAWQQNYDILIQNIEITIGFPCIVKPHDDGCSVMVEKIDSSEELAEHITSLFVQKTVALVEEFITGMELTVGVIGNEQPRALPPSQAVTTHTVLSMQEKFLPGAGENQTPAPLPTQALQLVQQTIERAYTTLQCKGYARIDCFYQSAMQSPTGQERVIILEVNTLPALTPATCIFHQALEVGIKPMDFIDKIIALGIQEHGITTETSTASLKEHNV